LKYRKNRPALRALLHRPLTLALFRYRTLIIHPYCKLWRQTLCITFWSHLRFGKFGKGGPLTSFLGRPWMALIRLCL